MHPKFFLFFIIILKKSTRDITNVIKYHKLSFIYSILDLLHLFFKLQLHFNPIIYYFLQISMYWYFYCAQQMEMLGLPLNQAVQSYQPEKSLPIIIPSEDKKSNTNTRPQGQYSSFIQLSRYDLEKFGQSTTKKLWSQEQDKLLLSLAKKHNLEWEQVSKQIPNRNAKMCYSRYRRLEYSTKNSWKKREQDKLLQLIGTIGFQWKEISQQMQNRTAKQVKQHYMNYLRPGINKEQWSIDEDFKLVELLNVFGPNWKRIQQEFSERSQNQIKNRYFGRLKKLQERKLQQNGDLLKIKHQN